MTRVTAGLYLLAVVAVAAFVLLVVAMLTAGTGP